MQNGDNSGTGGGLSIGEEQGGRKKTKAPFRKSIQRMIERVFPAQALPYRAYSNLIKNEKSYLYSTGWMRSLEARKPLDKDGNPIPWMNHTVVKLLDERLTHDLSLFEYGSGYSTCFYARKVKSVFSMEYNKLWFDNIQSNLPDNAKIILIENDIDGNYCRAISSTRRLYDVVVVDGRDRVNCVKQALPSLSSRGVVLLDDSHRARYREAIDFAVAHGFKALNLEGMKATGARVDRTTIFYRHENCLGL